MILKTWSCLGLVVVNDTLLKPLQEVVFRLLASSLFHFIITAGKNEFAKKFVLRKELNFFEDFL